MELTFKKHTKNKIYFHNSYFFDMTNSQSSSPFSN